MDVAYDVNSGWQSLVDEMNATILHIKSITPEEAAIVVEIQLRVAYLEWESVLLLAGQL